MKNFVRALPLLLVVLPFALLPLAANPLEATFVGVNGAQDFGYYVGPYDGRLEQQSVVLDCVDFANEVSFGQQWAVNLSHIDTQQDLPNTRFGARVNALQLYQEAAWLTLQYSLNPSSVYGDIQATIWQLFDQFAPSPSTGYWLSQAQSSYAAANYGNFFVVTNVGPVNPDGQIQEFLTTLDPTMPVYPAPPGVNTGVAGTLGTPEPRLFVPVGLALAAMALFLRWLRHRYP